MSNLNEELLSWLRKAENDFLNIENNLSSERVPWDTVCFHAQQAAEKLLKTAILARGIRPPRTHDLLALLSICSEGDPSLSVLVEECRMLTSFAVEIRYPHPSYEPNEEEAMELVEAARGIREMVHLKLGFRA